MDKLLMEVYMKLLLKQREMFWQLVANARREREERGKN